MFVSELQGHVYGNVCIYILADNESVFKNLYKGDFIEIPENLLKRKVMYLGCGVEDVLDIRVLKEKEDIG